MKRESQPDKERQLPGRRPLLQRYVASAALFGIAGSFVACSQESTEPTPTPPPVTTTDIAPSTATPTSEAAAPSVLATSEQLPVGLEVYYGDTCQQIAESQAGNTIRMDYVNSAVNVYSGDHNSSLKQGLLRRVGQALHEDSGDVYTQLNLEQTAVLQASINSLVDATYGGDQAPNDKRYMITVAQLADGAESRAIPTPMPSVQPTAEDGRPI